MKPHELALRCINAVNSDARLSLVIPSPPPRGEKVRIERGTRKVCPLGEVLNWQEGPPRVVASFDPLEVLAWLAARGVVKVVYGAEPDR